MASHLSLRHNLVSAVRKAIPSPGFLSGCFPEQSSTIRIPCGQHQPKMDNRVSQFPVYQESTRRSKTTLANSALKSPKGFGPSPKRSKKARKPGKILEEEEEEEEEEKEVEEDDPSAGIIPEVVTNRMMKRMGLSIGIPLSIGLLFFPLFYYLKVGFKIDVPTWVPFIVSFFFFGSALLGVSYGIVSSSWDPLREGSLLGWNEAQKNWPVFWQSIWGGGSSKNK